MREEEEEEERFQVPGSRCRGSEEMPQQAPGAWNLRPGTTACWALLPPGSCHTTQKRSPQPLRPLRRDSRSRGHGGV